MNRGDPEHVLKSIQDNIVVVHNAVLRMVSGVATRMGLLVKEDEEYESDRGKL